MSDGPLRVLVVDDSPLNRRALRAMLQEHEGVEVVGAASGGDEALRLVAALSPNLITLDLEMPRMDGFTFLRLLMASRPTPVIVISSHSAKENVFRALELGAIDFIAKPNQSLAGGVDSVKLQLDQMLRVVRHLARTNWQHRRASAARARPGLETASGPGAGQRPPTGVGRSATLTTQQAARPLGSRAATHGSSAALGSSASTSSAEGPRSGLTAYGLEGLPTVGSERPSKVVVVASSTGGPTALLEVFSKLPAESLAAVLVAQHMPDRFTRAFAERLDRLSAFDVREAAEHQSILPGSALVCPGGRCLEVRRAGQRYAGHVLWPDKDDRYAPSADRLFVSAARAAGRDVIGVVLTGMGDDGARGAVAIKEAGGIVLAESEQTAVVFGMPRAAARMSDVDEVLPLSELVQHLVKLL